MVTCQLMRLTFNLLLVALLMMFSQRKLSTIVRLRRSGQTARKRQEDDDKDEVVFVCVWVVRFIRVVSCLIYSLFRFACADLYVQRVSISRMLPARTCRRSSALEKMAKMTG